MATHAIGQRGGGGSRSSNEVYCTHVQQALWSPELGYSAVAQKPHQNCAHCFFVKVGNARAAGGAPSAPDARVQGAEPERPRSGAWPPRSRSSGCRWRTLCSRERQAAPASIGLSFVDVRQWRFIESCGPGRAGGRPSNAGKGVRDVDADYVHTGLLAHAPCSPFASLPGGEAGTGAGPNRGGFAGMGVVSWPRSIPLRPCH